MSASSPPVSPDLTQACRPGRGRGESFSHTQLAVPAPGRRCSARARCPPGRTAALPQSRLQWPGPRVEAADQLDSLITRIPKHPDLTIGQKRNLRSIAKICNVNYLRVLMKRQYMHMIQHNSHKPGVLVHHRSHLSSCHSKKQHYPCTTWRHQLERGDSGSSNIAAASAPEMIIQHSLWRPVRNKGGLKTGYASKTRCKSLKIFRKPGRLFMQSVSTNDFESYTNEEKKEDLLSKCMQSMSIEEQGEHLMLT